MSTSKKAFREATAFLKQFDNLIELAEQVEEAGSLENIVTRLKGEVSNLEGTVAARLAAADADVAKRLADADQKAKATVVAAERRAAELDASSRGKADLLCKTAIEEGRAVATAEAARIVGEAKAAAEARAREAIDRVAVLDGQHASAKAKHEKEAADLAASNQAAQEKLAGVNRDIVVRERRLEQIKGEVANTLAKYAV